MFKSEPDQTEKGILALHLLIGHISINPIFKGKEKSHLYSFPFYYH